MVFGDIFWWHNMRGALNVIQIIVSLVYLLQLNMHKYSNNPSTIC